MVLEMSHKINKLRENKKHIVWRKGKYPFELNINGNLVLQIS